MMSGWGNWLGLFAIVSGVYLVALLVIIGLGELLS